jgi:penicillin-binding protein 2
MNNLFSDNKQSWLTWFLRGSLILLFLVLFAKLFEIQIIKGEYYRNLSDNNRIRKVIIPAPRGRILASGGEVLAGNEARKVSVKFTENGGFVLSDDLTAATDEEIVTDYQRYYPLNDKFSHALGYLARAGDADVGKINPYCPGKGTITSGQLIGKTGLEEQYECLLSGTPGEEIIEVDASGHQVRILGKRDPIPGRDLLTSIDYGLQIKLADLMAGSKGAAIVANTKNQILAFYSYPSFDPNIFITAASHDAGKTSANDEALLENSDKISSLLNNKDLPFFDRVIGGTFHPGSVFKPLVALAALEEGVIDKNFTYNDTGVITVNNYSYSNWYFTEYGRTEGPVGLVKAIARSTDTFFYTIGQMVGPDNIAKWAGYFGLDSKTGIDIPGEVKGLIPTTEWKKETKGEAWFLGNTYHMSIGQGDVAVTPIEINTYIAAIADNGNLCQPLFNKLVASKCKKVKVNQNSLNLVRQGMNAACSTGGTAFTFFDFPATHQGINVDCKTGTAEVSTDGTPHAWFTFIAPSDNPQIIATVLIEKGGQGSSVAGPIARSIADYYFQSFSSKPLTQ